MDKNNTENIMDAQYSKANETDKMSLKDFLSSIVRDAAKTAVKDSKLLNVLQGLQKKPLLSNDLTEKIGSGAKKLSEVIKNIYRDEKTQKQSRTMTVYARQPDIDINKNMNISPKTQEEQKLEAAVSLATKEADRLVKEGGSLEEMQSAYAATKQAENGLRKWDMDRGYDSSHNYHGHADMIHSVNNSQFYLGGKIHEEKQKTPEEQKLEAELSSAAKEANRLIKEGGSLEEMQNANKEMLKARENLAAWDQERGYGPEDNYHGHQDARSDAGEMATSLQGRIYEKEREERTEPVHGPHEMQFAERAVPFESHSEEALENDGLKKEPLAENAQAVHAENMMSHGLQFESNAEQSHGIAEGCGIEEQGRGAEPLGPGSIGPTTFQEAGVHSRLEFEKPESVDLDQER